MLTHDPLRETGPLIVVLAIVAYAVAPDRRSGLIVVGLLVAGIVLLVLPLTVAARIAEGRRRARVEKLAELGRRTGAAREDVAAGADAWLVAGQILRGDPLRYRGPVADTPSLLAGADGDDAVAGACRAVVLRHQPWSKEAERAVWAMRQRVEGEAETAAWLGWFLDAQVGWPEFADRIAQAGAWALPRMPVEARRPLLIRTLRRARDDQAWRAFAKALRADIDRLDEDEAPAFLRRGSTAGASPSEP